MRKTSSISQITIIAIIIALSSFVIYLAQNHIQHALLRKNLHVEVMNFDPGLQHLDIDDVKQLDDKRWSHQELTNPSSLYLEQELWQKITFKNNSDTSQKIVISETGNYITEQKTYSDTEISELNISYSNEFFAKQIVLAAYDNKTVYVNKKGYQVSSNTTLIYHYDKYRLKLLLSLVTSAWTYGAIIGIILFYLANIQSNRTHLIDRLIIFGFACSALLVTLAENNYHSLFDANSPLIDSMGKKIALPLIIVPLSSYLLLHTFSLTKIDRKLNPIQQLCLIFAAVTLALAYCLISRKIIPVIYIGFTTIAFLHQICWIYYAAKSDKLNNYGTTAALAFLICSTANHVLVIAISILPNLAIARINIINLYYLVTLASAIIMLNDKNITASLLPKTQAQKKTPTANNKTATVIDNLLDQSIAITPPQQQHVLDSLHKLKLIHQEIAWPRNIINLNRLQKIIDNNLFKQNNNKENHQHGRQLLLNHEQAFKLLKDKVDAQQAPIAHTTLQLDPSKNSSLIIIIDDDLDAAKNTANAIQQNKPVELFTNPLQAIEFIRLQLKHNQCDKIESIICDYEMPELNGIQTLEAINDIYKKSNKQPPKLIIFSSISSKLKNKTNFKVIEKTKTRVLIESL